MGMFPTAGEGEVMRLSNASSILVSERRRSCCVGRGGALLLFSSSRCCGGLLSSPCGFIDDKSFVKTSLTVFIGV